MKVKKQQKQEPGDILPPSDSTLAELNIDPAEIKSINPRSKRRQYRAVINWLTKCQFQPDASNLEKVKGYVEAFYHLCEVEAWQKANEIINTTLKTPTNEQLRSQLNTWGYYREKISLHERLLGKLSPDGENICLNGLGNAYYSLGDYPQAIKFYEQCLHFAQEVGDTGWKGTAFNGLGVVYHALGNYPQAIDWQQQHLAVAESMGDRKAQANALCNLGNILFRTFIIQSYNL